MTNKRTRYAAETTLDVLPGTFIDLAGFVLALDAYRKLRGEDDPHVKKATGILMRNQDVFAAGAAKFLLPLVDDATFARFRNVVTHGIRPTRGLAQAALQAEMVSGMFLALHARQTVLKEVFADTRAVTTAMKIGGVLANDAPESILSGLATVPPASHMQLTRKWVREAAEMAGVAPSAVETVLADVTAARMIGDDIHSVEAQIANTDPVSTAAADLQTKKQELLTTLGKVVKASPDPAVVLATAATQSTQSTEYATKTAKAQRLSSDQERAMMIRGKGIIAAGAGSGKTATLASKVAYHINELGVPPGAIIATSFSRKSAAELFRRIEKYGANIPPSAETGFGTTHSIAGKLMREYGGGGREGLKSFEQTSLIRLAMEQVRMKGAPSGPPAPTSLFTVAPEAPVVEQAPLTFREACELAFARRNKLSSFLSAFIASYFDPRDKWYRSTMSATQNLTNPRGLTDKQAGIIQDIFRFTGVDYHPSTDPNLAARARTAARDKDKGLREKFRYFSAPARQWFNLGLPLTEKDSQGNETPIPAGVFKQAITKFKGAAVSPSEAWAMTGGDPTAAVYAAYEWLKGPMGETDFQNRGDFDDILLDVSKMLLENPRTLRQVQSRFKVILVDEAQDLNRAQHLMFGLIAGFLDPAKVPLVAGAEKLGALGKDDGSMTADTYAFIGDDKQCVERSSAVVSARGIVQVGDLQPGDEIQAYRNGKVVFQRVRYVVPSSWTCGYKVTTLSGHTLTMSPNHKLWASEPRTEEGQMAVYLMYRKDMGFRIGITNKGKVDSGEEYLNSYGGRAFLEKAERLWILDIVEGREEALLRELDLSLTYGIPTMVFGGENRGLNQDRIDTIFKKHGHNGAQLLADRHLSFNLPHWMSQSYTKHGRERHTIQFNAHGNQGSNVSLEWEGPKFDEVLAGFKVSIAGERRRLRRWFSNYREGLAFAEELAQRTEANLSYRLSTPDGVLRETTASGLFVGMSLPVLNTEHNTVVHDEIVSIEKVDGSFIDLDVDDASTFFANGILTSNSIYSFRGADPEAFIDMSDLVEGGAGFKTEVLKTNYRSGELIVEAANRLIKHNSKQIPMTCKANPQRVDRGGIDVVQFAPIEGRDMKVPAEWLAETIASDMAEGRAGSKGYDAYGVGLRSNAEAYAYGVALIQKGIPFRSKANFFNDPNTKALLHWLTLADEGASGNVERINAAVLGARSVPATKLGATFEDKLTQMATGNYLEWLESNAHLIYSGSWGDLLQAYIANLKTIAALKGSPAEQVLAAVMSLQGFDGRSVEDVLLDKVREDEEVLAEIRAESATGTVTEEAIAEIAFAPIAPLKGLLAARADLTEAMKYTRQLQAANAKLSAVDDPDAKGVHEPAVTLGTMHSWKGLEVENMFLPLVGGRFPRVGSTEEELASERRLAYVAVTRGENRVLVLNIPTVRRTKAGPIVEVSQFISEMCLASEDDDAEGEVLALEEANARVASMSPQDEEAMDAYLAGRPLTEWE